MEPKTQMNALAAWDADLASHLKHLKERDRLRSLHKPFGTLDFASNDYLSLNSDGTLLEILKECAGAWESRVGSTGSRLIRGHDRIFDEAESDFAEYAGSAASLLFHSGYAANLGVIEALTGPRDTVFVDRLCHASLLDGVRLSGAERVYFEHNDLDHLEEMLQKRRGRGRAWIVTESVFSMDGDTPPLTAICDLAERFDALVILDEAHALGVVGPGGAGLAAAENLQDRIAVTVFPCGKAPGMMGAFVCGSRNLKETLVNKARSLIFSTAQPPFLALILMRVVSLLSSPLMEMRRNTLRHNAEILRSALKDGGLNTGVSTSHIIPVILGEDSAALQAAGACREAGIDARAIRPPSVPQGTSRLRISVQSGHKIDDLNRLVSALAGHSVP
ncbi:MAG: 8-amino-7-oxononanoate synthase [Spirochaetia bacterium]|nr:8-amino-7-oxononanoate synthase [Spirochaetia bacterium]